uniref:Uncharacterized protein n=1 Tax=Arundo donax TaxID=35708 RepID=A0A0A9B5F6_ARUDO
MLLKHGVLQVLADFTDLELQSINCHLHTWLPGLDLCCHCLHCDEAADEAALLPTIHLCETGLQLLKALMLLLDQAHLHELHLV